MGSKIYLEPKILALLNLDKSAWPKQFMGHNLFVWSFANFAFNKCLNQVDYIDQNIVIKGNAQNHLYNYLQIMNGESNAEEYYDLLDNLLKSSDQALAEGL